MVHMANFYNVSAAVGRVATYITAILATVLGILFVIIGAGLIQTPRSTGVVVTGKVDSVTPGCEEPFGKACTVTASYEYNGKPYTSSFRSMTQSYSVGDVIMVRVLDETNPSKAEEDFPKRTTGWAMLSCAVLIVCIAAALYQFAADSKNFAAGAGILTFIQALAGLVAL